MRTHHLFSGALLVSVIFSGHHALAFTIDERSGTNSDGSPRYVDPDDQVPPYFIQGQTRSNNYDRNFGPQYTAPASEGSSQGLKFPDWLFPTAPRRK
jgi:hypothetical protein